MTRRQASGLKPGEVVMVSDGFWGEQPATVVRVTERGGVLVRERDGEETWHPYSRVQFEG